MQQTTTMTAMTYRSAALMALRIIAVAVAVTVLEAAEAIKVLPTQDITSGVRHLGARNGIGWTMTAAATMTELSGFGVTMTIVAAMVVIMAVSPTIAATMIPAVHLRSQTTVLAYPTMTTRMNSVVEDVLLVLVLVAAAARHTVMIAAPGGKIIVMVLGLPIVVTAHAHHIVETDPVHHIATTVPFASPSVASVLAVSQIADRRVVIQAKVLVRRAEEIFCGSTMMARKDTIVRTAGHISSYQRITLKRRGMFRVDL